MGIRRWLSKANQWFWTIVAVLWLTVLPVVGLYHVMVC